ncbi:MAG: DUF4349 domain-containing protein [Anaerolineales bacterium]
MKRLALIPLLLASALIISACGGSLPATQSAPLESFQGETMEMEAPSADAIAGSAANTTRSTTDLPSVQDRLVIRNANVSLVVEDPAQSVDTIASMAEGMGGYVVSSNVFENTFGDNRLGEPITAKQANITVRVPSDQLEAALDQIKAGAIEVRNQNISGQDVTEEFTDLQSRLGNLQAAEAELREIMDSASRRDKIEDVLAVLNQLRQVREEIEVKQGRIQYLQQSARLSSISVDLIPDVATQPLQIGRWTPQGTAREAIAALIGALQWIADAAIWGLLCVLPVAIVAGVPAWIAIRSILRRRKNKPDERKADESESEAS